ncbi:sensor domain-containing protein [Halomonas alkalicola]|uniref:sensor domain-containing protein n=1 Tax=Halomonas alkalicola TaxID=1930622 RepID=UPI00265D9613|nr:diguanylate cyclase [Halomonas alkalicola]
MTFETPQRSVATQSLFDRLPVGTYAVEVQADGKLRFHYVSDRFLQMCGLARDVLMADSARVMSVIHPDDRDAMLQANLTAHQTQQPFHWEGRLRVQERDTWVAISSNPRHLVENRTLWEGVMIDISAYKKLESDLRASQARLQRLLEHLPIATSVVELGSEGRVLFSNAEFHRTFGYTPEEVPTVEEWFALAYPDPQHRAKVRALWSAAQREAMAGTGQIKPVEFGVTCKDGSLRDVLISATIDEGVMIVSFQDITQQKRTQAELRLSEYKFRTLVEDAYAVIYTLNLKGEFQFLSSNLFTLLGYAPEELSGLHFASIVHPDDMAHCEAFMERVYASNTRQGNLEYRVRHRDGQWHWHVTNASPLHDADGQLIGMIGNAHDVSERKARETRMSRQATYDELTGLLNRAAFFERVDQLLDGAEAKNPPAIGLMFIDLDNFKQINDTHGHAAGDRVLQILAARLQSALRSSDLCGRIGGDEFLSLLYGVSDADTATRIAVQVLQQLVEPITLGELPLLPSCSIGIALSSRHGREISELVRHADEAMYRVKQSGRNGVCLAE